jgi:biotin carboxyl carrier protein
MPTTAAPSAKVSPDARPSDDRKASASAPAAAPAPSCAPALAPALASRVSRSAAVLALQARALAHEDFDAAAAEVMNQLSRQLGCARTSLGLMVGGRLRVVATTGAGGIDTRSGEAQRIRAAMAEALDQRLEIVHPLPAGATPAITVAHAALAAANGQAAIFSVPIATRHELMGVLLLERAGGFDIAARETAKDAAMFVGPILALGHRAQTGIARRIARALSPQTALRPFGGKRRFPWRLALGAAGLALAALALVPTTRHVVSNARIEGRVQQVLSVPVDSFLASVAVRPGETVKAGQVLAVLDTRDLVLERDKWAAELASLDKQYREALSRDDAAPIMAARAKIDVARSQHELVAQQIERSTLRAPMDGVILSGDLSQSVGIPVKRGQELMTIAPDAGFRIVAEVDEQEVSLVREGQAAQALFAALGSGEALRLTVARVAPVATQTDGRNVFDVEAAPSRSPVTLRAGMRGVVRIESGREPLASIWWDRAQRAWRRLAWQLMG